MFGTAKVKTLTAEDAERIKVDQPSIFANPFLQKQTSKINIHLKNRKTFWTGMIICFSGIIEKCSIVWPIVFISRVFACQAMTGIGPPVPRKYPDRSRVRQPSRTWGQQSVGRIASFDPTQAVHLTWGKGLPRKPSCWKTVWTWAPPRSLEPGNEALLDLPGDHRHHEELTACWESFVREGECPGQQGRSPGLCWWHNWVRFGLWQGQGGPRTDCGWERKRQREDQERRTSREETQGPPEKKAVCMVPNLYPFGVCE